MGSIKVPRKEKGNHAKWIPTNEELETAEMLASIGLNPAQIAHHLGFFPESLGARSFASKEFAEAVESGRARGFAQQAAAMFSRGLSGSTVDAIFWMKNNGWADKPQEQPQQTINQQNIQVIVPQVYKNTEDWKKSVEVSRDKRIKDTEAKLAIEMKEQGMDDIIDIPVHEIVKQE